MIKKLLRASAASLFAIALVFSLCSCAGTSESDTQSLVSNPFETSGNLRLVNLRNPNLKMMISANIRKPKLHSATTALKASQL